MQRQIDLGPVEFRDDHTEPPFAKTHIRPVSDQLIEVTENSDAEETTEGDDEEMATQVRGSYFYKQSQVAMNYLKKLVGAKVFNNPKDHEELAKLFRYVLAQVTSVIIVDFFAGSGSTAEAVLQINAEDHTDHKFILVQLPEPCNPKERSGKAALAMAVISLSAAAKSILRRSARRFQSSCQPTRCKN